MSSEMIAHCSHQAVSRNTTSYPYNHVPVKRSFILNKLQKTYKKFQEKPLPPEFKPRLDGPSVTWKIFSRLAMAIEFADSSTSDCMIFSFEEKVGNPGQRLFLVTSVQKMWANHRSKQLEQRCTYEVIRENHPCKLYFDLEFYRCFNSEKDGDRLTNTLIKCVIAAMYEQYNFLFKDSDFLWLDSSTDEKFSSHLILQSKGVAFQDNIHAGMFVSLLTSTLRKRIEENSPSDELWPSAQEIKSLLVNSKKGKEIFFYDEGVYTKNRNFRLYLSTKQGKKAPLVLSPHNKYIPLVHPRYEERAVFYDSLVTYFRSQKIYRILSYEKNSQGSLLNNPLSRMKSDNPGVSGCASSPFPELDNFVLGIIQDGTAVGSIRKWTYFSSAQKIIYDIYNYRFCGNIGRHHKSNNIKIVIDLKMKCFYQTCLDPECRQENYKSEGTSDAIHFSEELFKSNKNENFDNNLCQDMNFDSEEFSELPKMNLCQDMDFDFEDFSELQKINCDTEKKAEKDESKQQSWDAFFAEDSNSTEIKVDQEENGNADEDFSSMDDGFWDTQPAVRDSAASLGNISFDDELLMANAAEAVEATINESAVLEETIF